MIENEYPQEYFIELDGLSPILVGRVTIFEVISTHNCFYNLEIDIVQSESGKIYNHVRSMFNQVEAREALDSAVQYLKEHLESKRI
jgi:hypothetical protein